MTLTWKYIIQLQDKSQTKPNSTNSCSNVLQTTVYSELINVLVMIHIVRHIIYLKNVIDAIKNDSNDFSLLYS